MTFTDVFCVAEDLILGSLKSQLGALHLLGISLSSWKSVQEPNLQDRDPNVFPLLLVGDGLMD